MTEPDVRGTVAAGFEPVRDEFAAILAGEGADLDAQVAACYRGELVVDLWAGTEATGESLLGIYSAGKGVAHLVVALLVQDGALDLDQRVSHYWPQFGAAGKREILLRELLSHQAGLVGVNSGFSMEELAEDQFVAERLGAQRPLWRPGSASGYHALVMAALSGEVVRRVTGATVQSLFATRLRDPYKLDLHLGLPADQEHRFLSAQPMVATPERLRDLAATATAPDSLNGIAFNRHHPENREVWELPNLPVVRSAGPASFGGIGTARALAKLYSAVIGTIDGLPPLLTPDTAAAFAQIQYAGWDLVLRQHKAWAVGFHPVSELYPSLGAGAFGHSGAGGQQALVDPRHELSYAFLRRRFLYPPQADADHNRILRALRAATETTR
ncbi:beta-lactamase family protein [Amycolatopsis acidiphila]|uniref:Beta-lactamase family protein n=1 Tax=Amycolatopsis acidiphila TaxID=715473 RepID=A0A558ADV0_9PSEU|nr:serine hydrolase domain-containing protein [Amycolatopsis acidiphila]TVT22393.1 beta-lactamase family protein [Amycolatopsis acidiphila]UIJ57592.1 beta-lactamase family protein [Amycolatopsis acidiphila]GHG89686.1 serine hydrolase [Amycolatopsis acidiphila]